MLTGIQTIDGVKYEFSALEFLLVKEDNPSPSGNTGTKTIKNYLAGALLPVGQALFTYGVVDGMIPPERA